MKRSHPQHVFGVHVGALLQEQPADAGVSLLGRHMQRGLVHFSPGVSAAASLQEDIAGLLPVVEGGQVKRGGAQPICGEGGSTGHELPHTLRKQK